jgi:hypothetical protein
MVVPSPCCTGCPLLRATDTREITADYKRGKHTDRASWQRPLTHVAAPADVEQFYAMLGAMERKKKKKKKKKKKGVTRVAHAATLQLNPAMEGYSQYEKGNHQDKPHP